MGEVRAPRVSVIMPVYNAEKYVALAIENILNQTYSNFEFLIMDDGSTDTSREIIARFAAKDMRIRAFYSERNLGIVTHLNDGILRARGEYVARIDSDDISLAHRFMRQVQFLDANPGVAVVGSSTITIAEDGADLDLSLRNTSPASLFWQSFFTNPLAHPSVMFRKSAIIRAGLYDPKKVAAQDFDLWTRVLKEDRIANIEEPLVKYRLHNMSVSSRLREVQRRHSADALCSHWLFFFGARIENDIVYFLKNYHRGYELPVGRARATYYLIMKLYLRVVLMHGFTKYVERDAFSKFYYLAARARHSFLTVIELSMILGFLFPLRTLRRIIIK